MPPGIESSIVFTVMVALFAWLYARDRHPRVKLWLCGWIAVLLHFAGAPLQHANLISPGAAIWITTGLYQVAGTFFLLSVSEVFATPRRRLGFVVFITADALLYLTVLIAGSQQRWIFIALLLVSTLFGLYQAVSFYGWRSPYLYSISLMLPYSGWVIRRAYHGDFWQGLYFYMFGFFAVTGLVYYRHFRRFTPGVIFTAISFFAWGCIAPVGNALFYSRHIGPGPGSFVWDLPRFFVAFGMILTLLENQTEVAKTVAGQYQNLFENNLAAVYVSTFSGKLLNCNGAFLKMYGFNSKEEALAHPVDLLYTQPSARQLFLDDLCREGQLLNYECTQRRQDGTLFWILERAVLIPGPSGERVIEGTAIDITERKQSELALRQSEERFATIFRQSPVGCGILSLDGVFLNVNENLLRMLARPAEQVIGKSAVELGFWPNRQIRDEFFHKLRAEGSLQNIEIKFKDSLGNQHVGLYFATIVRIGGKECIFGMQLDQTEERALEAKFLQAQKMEALGRLAGGVAHDFNNMLGVIGSYAELLEAKLETGENLRRYCTKILDTTQRAAGLTRQLLTFSRKEIVRPMPMETAKALTELTAILPRLIGEDIELVVNLRATGTVVIDKTHFEQVIFNIVINARDAMPGGGQLFIETEDVLRPVFGAGGGVSIGQYVAIRIRDTGIGMDEETRQHAFEPFYTTKEIGRGTGLGLATVYGIVQQCRGEIGIDSIPRKGTQVNILLPAASSRTMAAPDDSAREIKKGQGNILLVEDEAELRNVNAEFLTSLGYRVTCAGSGPEALEYAAGDPAIDLVISDVVMPKMTGREFADRLLQLRPNTKLLYVSGYADDVILQSGVPTQGIIFLQKPYSLRQLSLKVQSLLSGAARSAEIL
ncbi:MAG TPA: PAS domain S-box protein [Candidatus Angelobacter sp.]|nr:PAS domain S-box protein [Candidatus Angelobacter sp.]